MDDGQSGWWICICCHFLNKNWQKEGRGYADLFFSNRHRIEWDLKKKKKKSTHSVFCWCYSVTTGWTCCGYDDIVLITNLEGLTEKWTILSCIWVYVKKGNFMTNIAFMYKKEPKRPIHLHACTAHTTRLPHVSGCIQRYSARTLWLTFNRVVDDLVRFFLMAIPLPNTASIRVASWMYAEIFTIFYRDD